MHGSGDVLRVDQAELETVIPAPGGRVRVLGGAAAGADGELVAVQVDAYKASVRVLSGREAGRVLALEYEQVCRLA